MAEHPSSTGVLEQADGGQPQPSTGISVPALTYQQLRLLAETAAGVKTGPAQFFFDEAGTLMRSEPGAVLADDDVLIPAQDTGRFPRNGMRLEVEGTESPGPGFDPQRGVADAVFWSDAAVQKFLVPYVASCFGDLAGEMVTKLQAVWNNYPTEKVTVYALVHLTSHDIGTPLDMGDTVQVVFTEQAPVATPLRALTIRDFYDTFRPTLGPIAMAASPSVSYQRGEPTPLRQQPDYKVLRAMAEWAASLRDGPGYFVFPAGARGFLPPVYPLKDVQPGDVVVPAYTPSVPQNRPYLGGVWFQPENVDLVTNLAVEGDALFWSTGSIEQFLFPYYASKGGLEALPDLEEIHRVWTEPQSVEVYGLIHLPSSEWAEITIENQAWQPGNLPQDLSKDTGAVTEGADARHGKVVRRVEPRRQIGVVHADFKGRTRVTRVDHFIARYHRQRA